MRFILFFLLFFVFIGGGISYTWIRGAQAFSPVASLRMGYHILTIVLVVCFFSGLFLGNYLPASLAKTVSFVGNSYFLVLAYLLMGFLLIDLVLLVNHFVHFIYAVSTFKFISAIVLISVIGISMVMGNLRFNKPQRVELNIASNKEKVGKKIKIVAVSDLHLGISIDKKRVRKYVDIINSEQADIVLIAGDLVDRSLKPLLEQQMDEELREIDTKMGVFAVYGNHEHFTQNMEATQKFFNDANITLLNDSATLIDDSFYVVGRDDQSNAKRKTLQEIMQGFDPSKVVLLMDHQPTQLDEIANAGVDFQISGHTHNGQFFPGNWVVKKMFELGYGYKQKADSHIYVSSGLGIWGPQYRIGTQSEWVVINFSY